MLRYLGDRDAAASAGHGRHPASDDMALTGLHSAMRAPIVIRCVQDTLETDS